LRSGYLWLASFAAAPLAAWPLLAHPAYRRFSLACRAGLAAAVGGVLISGWMTLFGLAGIRWVPAILFVVSAMTAFLLRFLLLPESTRPPEKSGIEWSEAVALGVSAAAILIALFATTSASATSPDLILFWGPKAQAFASARTFDVALLGDPAVHYLHVSYPPLVTNLYAFASLVAGRFPWGAVTLTFPLCLAVLALSLPRATREIGQRRTALFASSFVVAAFGFLGNNLDVAGNGEPWLWLYETLAAALLLGPIATTSAGQLLAGLLLAGAASAKVEGLPFVLAVAALFLILRRREVRILSASVLLLAPTAVSLGAWFAFGATRRIFQGYEQYGSFFTVQWSEFTHVSASIGKAFWSAGWALPWILPLAAFLIARRKSPLALLPLLVSLALAAFFVFTYLHQPDSTLWISWSAGRVFSPLVSLLALASLQRRGGEVSAR
jgi:hypothetical protein